MTKDGMRTAIRSMAKEESTETGTLFPANNTLIDFFIDSALELVMIDVAREFPHRFLSSELVSLTADVAYATLATEWLQIMSVEKNVDGENPKPIIVCEDINQLQDYMYVGETAEEPRAVYFDATKIYFAPTPSQTTSEYIKVRGLAMEATTMPDAGPTYLPRPAHRLVVFKAMELIAAFNESSETKWYIIYQKALAAVKKVCGEFIQGQPMFVKPSFEESRYRDDRDPTLFDTSGFFK